MADTWVQRQTAWIWRTRKTRADISSLSSWAIRTRRRCRRHRSTRPYRTRPSSTPPTCFTGVPPSRCPAAYWSVSSLTTWTRRTHCSENEPASQTAQHTPNPFRAPATITFDLLGQNYSHTRLRPRESRLNSVTMCHSFSSCHAKDTRTNYIHTRTNRRSDGACCYTRIPLVPGGSR